MARARQLKPGFFANELLAECSHAARLLFAGLLTLADREGRLEDRPARIKGMLFPYGSERVDRLLDELATKSDPDGSPAFIVRYEAAGRRYIQIVNFVRHQNPHHREPASVIPAPCPGLLRGRAPVAPEADPGPAPEFPVPAGPLPSSPFPLTSNPFPLPPSPNPLTPSGEKDPLPPSGEPPAVAGGGSLSSDLGSRPPAKPDPALDGFEEFWAKCPPDMRKAPAKAREVWAGLPPGKRAAAIAGIKAWWIDWLEDWKARGRPKDVSPPFAATWLLQERWGDARSGASPPPAAEPHVQPAHPMESAEPHEPWEVGDAATG